MIKIQKIYLDQKKSNWYFGYLRSSQSPWHLKHKSKTKRNIQETMYSNPHYFVWLTFWTICRIINQTIPHSLAIQGILDQFQWIRIEVFCLDSI